MAGRAFSAFYARSFEQHPWITLGVANASLGVLADVIAQGFETVNKRRSQEISSTTISDKKKKGEELASRNENAGYDPVRSARFFVFGAGMAPILAEWNKFIEHRFPLKSTSVASTGAAAAASSARTAVKHAAVAAGKTSLKAWAKRVAVDQIAFAPFGLVMFTGAMGIMEGRNIDGIKQKFGDMYIPALLANWQVWPLVQAINFRFMPLKYRVPFTSSVGVLWTVYLSILNMSKNKMEQETQELAQHA